MEVSNFWDGYPAHDCALAQDDSFLTKTIWPKWWSCKYPVERLRGKELSEVSSQLPAKSRSNFGSQAPERGFSSCGTRAQLLHGTWNLPRPGIKPLSPALAGGLFTTGPPGKSYCLNFCIYKSRLFYHDPYPVLTMTSLAPQWKTHLEPDF